MRVFVRDLNSKYVWGPAAPLIRPVVNSGLTFPFPPDPLMVEPLPGAPLKADAVYARWKVWRGLDVRDPLPLELRIRRLRRRGGVPSMNVSEIVTVPVDEDESPPQIF